MKARTDLASLIPARTMAPLAGLYTVAAIPGAGGHLVGRDDQGRACVLLASLDSGVRPPVRLGGLNAQYALNCRVHFGKSDETRVLSVVTSTNNSVDDERYFLHVMSAVLDLVGPTPSLNDLAEAITELAGIFQRLSRAARESVIGIAGELVLIALATDPVAAVTAWRNDPHDRYDFSANSLRLEVKSTASRRRQHEFSYEQADVPPGCIGIVASIFIEQSAGGLTIENLVLNIASRLTSSPAAIFRVQQVLAATLGADMPDALGFSFDMELASSELALFDLRQIPAVRSLPSSVTMVRFVSDLTAVPPVDLTAMNVCCPSLAQIAPQNH